VVDNSSISGMVSHFSELSFIFKYFTKSIKTTEHGLH
jgi:hypothetical protein